MVVHGTIHKLCIMQQKQKYTCQLAEQLAVHRINLVDKKSQKKKCGSRAASLAEGSGVDVILPNRLLVNDNDNN